MNRTLSTLIVCSVIAAAVAPVVAEANSGDFNGGVAIGSSYAGVDAAPTNGLIVQGNVGIGTSSPGDSLDLSQNSDALSLPTGTTAQRPTGTASMLRYNSTITGLEAYYGSAWNTLVQTVNPVVTGISSDTYTATGSTPPSIGLYAPAANTVGLSARSLPVIEGTNPASAVNYVLVTGAATGGIPSIAAAGGDTNIGLSLTPQGNGNVNVTSGSLLVGSTSLYANDLYSAPELQVTAASSTGGNVAIGDYVNDATSAGTITLYKSRGATQGTNTALTSGDNLGRIFFEGADGTNLKKGAAILGGVDNTVSTGVMPGRLDFYTTSAAGTSTIAARIDSNQHINFHGTAYTVSGCGASPTIVGNDVSGRITIGSSPTSACTVTFANHWTNAPTCWCNDETTALSCRVSGNSVSQATLNGAFAASDKVSFGCIGFF
jgi:hypothetical protein